MIKIHCGNYTDRRIHLWCVLKETIVTIILQMQPLYNPQRSTYPDPPKICHATTASNDNISHSKRTKDLRRAPNNRKKNLTYGLSTKKVQTNKPEQVNESVDLSSHKIWLINTNGCTEANTNQCNEPLQDRQLMGTITLVISDQHQRIIWHFNLKRICTETLNHELRYTLYIAP